MADQHTHLTVVQSNTVNIVEFADRRILEELSIAEIGDELSELVDKTLQEESCSALRTSSTCPAPPWGC